MGKKNAAATVASPYRLGKLPPRRDHRTLLLGNYLNRDLSPPPESTDFSKAVTVWPMMLNNVYGDCTCAAAGHMIQDWTANAGKPFVPGDDDIKAAYQHFVGSNLQKGVSSLDLLNFWRVTGIARHQIYGYAQLEPLNSLQVKVAIALFGTSYIGLGLPDFIAKSQPEQRKQVWQVPPSGPSGNARPNRNNGHAVAAVGYDPLWLYFVSWGDLKRMTWQFFGTYMDEAYAVLSQDWINESQGKSPSGFDFDTLKADLAKVVGG